MRAMRESEGYKYLGVLEADGMLHHTMKKKIGKEYLRRVRKVAQSKLNGGNLVRAINTWAVSLVRYSGGIVDWKKQELQDLDRRTRKLITDNERGLSPTGLCKTTLCPKAGMGKRPNFSRRLCQSLRQEYCWRRMSNPMRRRF